MKKILFSMIICSIVFFINTSISYGKYVIELEQLVAKLEIDRTKPTGTVEYSTTELTSGDVTVTIHLSEPIKTVKNWNLSDDKLTLQRVYSNNTEENVKIIDLSGNENTINVNVQNIDNKRPILEMTSFSNTNEDIYYANITHKIVYSFKVKDDNLDNKVDVNDIVVYVNDEIASCEKKITNIKQNKDELEFDLELTKFSGNGIMTVLTKEGLVKDKLGNGTEQILYELGIEIDNISPEVEISTERLSDGGIKVYLNTNERVFQIDSWSNPTYDERSFEKIFYSSQTVYVDIRDRASNYTKVKVSVIK